MIRGQVRSAGDDGAGLEARIPIGIVNSIGVLQTLEVVVDTGFTGPMSLPESIVLELGLDRRGNRPLTMADGRTELTPTYQAGLLWHGQPIDVLAYMMGDKPMVGVALLSPCHLAIDLWDGGAVVIEERTPPAQPV